MLSFLFSLRPKYHIYLTNHNPQFLEVSFDEAGVDFVFDKEIVRED
jgi:hypothetical protein